MLRKPILMPANLIEKVDRIAKDRNVSFAEVIRNAVDVFGEDDMTAEEETLLEALLDEVIRSTTDLAAKLDQTITY
ncbi:hypothetical protein [Desulfosarcina ovata]|uniref:Ribbon-helix-helix protein CopG domain-containing protein n=1 Tax=Desulfosarcina ovata subsp. ovata TaxID=2752305 RepID=A0A5K8ACS1_9BACT|nr:hypothetical protein [Desulfosarcina ovata]BBO89740.1 hypothetical protein DSCOOX_29200 [Desulfosarcina ovata subsp. ovata]